MHRWGAGLVATLVAFAAPMALATADPLIEGARQCTQYFPQQEQRNNIPTHLLAAIATTESGRHHDGLGMNVPWPWTINVEGKGYFFATKAEAVANTKNFLSKGYESIDVGCMQVNLKHHPDAFANLEDAFDPAKNVAYAAKFLRNNYASSGDWIKATAAYHSRTPQHGAQYLAQIEKSWNNIVGKVAAARANKEGGYTPTATQSAQARMVPPVRVIAQKSSAPHPVSLASATPARPALRSPLVIRVTDAPGQRSSEETFVARPVIAHAQPVKLAAATTPESESPSSGSTIRRVALDNRTATDDSGAVTRYVFAN